MYRQNGTPYRIGFQYKYRAKIDVRMLAFVLLEIAKEQTKPDT